MVYTGELSLVVGVGGLCVFGLPWLVEYREALATIRGCDMYLCLGCRSVLTRWSV